MLRWLRHFLKSNTRPFVRNRTVARRRPASYRPLLEKLEDRLAPAVIDWKSTTGGNWSTGSNWVGGNPPGASDVANFGENFGDAHTASFIDAAFSGTVAGITIGLFYNNTITDQKGITITGNFSQALGTWDGNGTTETFGNVSLSGSSIFKAPATLKLNNNWTRSSGTFTPGTGLVEVTGAATHDIDSGGAGGAFNSFAYESSGHLMVTAHDLQINGTLRQNIAGASFDANGFDVTVSGTTTLSVGNFLARSGTMTFNGGLSIQQQGFPFSGSGTFTGGTGTVNVTDVTIAAGTLTAPAGAFTFNVTGNWSKTGGTFNAGTNSVNFTKASGVQTLDSGGTGFNSLQHSGAGTLQLVNHSLSVAQTLFNPGTLDLNGLGLTVAGSFSNPGTLQLRGTEAVSLATGNDVAEGTWNYVGINTAGPITILDFGATDYYNLMVDDENATMATFRAGAPLNIANHFNVTSGTYDPNGNTTDVAGRTTIDGGIYKSTFAAQTLGFLSISLGSFTGGGPVNVSDVMLSGGTLTLNADGLAVSGDWSKTGGTFTPGFRSVVFNKASGTQTLDSGGATFGAINHNDDGTLQLGNNSLTLTDRLTTVGTLDLNGQGFSVASSLLNSGTIQLQGTETVTAPFNQTSSGTWRYVGNNTAGPLTIRDFGATDYFNLTIDDQNPTRATFQLAAPLSVRGAFTLSGGTFNANGQTTTVTGATTVDNSAYDGSTATQAFNGGLSLTAATLSNSGAGKFLLAGDLASNAASTTSTIAGSIQLSGAIQTFTVNDGPAATDLSINGGTLNLAASRMILTALASSEVAIFGEITGIGSGTVLTKEGTGLLRLGGANNYSGVTAINNGPVVLLNGGALGSAADSTVVASTGQIVVDSTAVNTEPLTINGVGFNGNGVLTASGTSSWAGPITLQTDSSISVPSVSDTLTLTGAVGGPGGLLTGNLGKLVLSNSGNNYGGPTTIGAFGAAGSKLALGGDNALPAASNLTVLAGSTCDLNGFNVVMASVDGTGTITNTAAVATLTLNTAVPDTFTGRLSGALALSKTGNKVLTLANSTANTYTGATTVSDGTLLVNDVQSSSAVTLAGGTLGGTGTVGAITGTGGTLAPGSSPGTFNGGAVTFDSNTTFAIELNGSAAGQFDQLVATSVSLGNSTLTVAANQVFPTGGVFKIISNTGNNSVAGTFNGLPEGTTFSAGGNNFTITYKGGDGNDVELSPAVAASITSGDSIAFTVGIAGTFTVTATGNPSPTLSESGALPSGVTFNPATGVLGGTPAANTDGTYNLVFTAHNGFGSDATQNFTLTVKATPTLGTLSQTQWDVNQPGYTGTIAVRNGTPPYGNLIASGLPAGLSAALAGSTITLTGTPTVTGTFSNVQISAKDSAGASATRTYTITINQVPALGTLSPTQWHLNQPGFNGSIAVNGGTAPFSNLSVTGLPSGLNASLNGGTISISGTPTQAGTFSSVQVSVQDAAGATAAQTETITIFQSPVLGGLSPTQWDVNLAGYNGTIAVVGGIAPYSNLSVTGLPSGLSATLNGSTIALTGTPAQTGTFSNVQVSIKDSGAATAAQTYSMTINPVLSLGTLSQAQWDLNQPGYSGAIAVTNGTSPYSNLSVTGLPAGVTAALNGSTIVLSGTPTQSGTFSNVQISLNDAAGATAAQTDTIIVNQPPTLGTLSPTQWPVNQPGYSGTIAIQGGTTPFGNLSVTNLPPGQTATLSGSTITLSGTPTQLGTYTNVQVSVQDAAGVTATQTDTITINNAPALGSLSPAQWDVDQPGYAGTIAVVGGVAPYSNLSVSGLPSGLSATLNGSTITATGTPTQTGTFGNAQVSVMDSVGAVATRTYTITINARPAITTTGLATYVTAGTAGYSQTIATSGGTAPFRFAVSAGSLPTGLSLNANTGVISGTPTAAGSSAFTVMATDGAAAVATQDYTVVVIPAGFVYAANTQTLTITGTSFTFTQVTTASGAGTTTTYTFVIDGVAQSFPDTVVSRVVAIGLGASATAILITSDTFATAGGQRRETSEHISLGSKADAGVGTIEKLDANGHAIVFLTLSSFPTSYAYVGRNDGTVLLYGTAGVPYNGFVSAGNYSYVGGPGHFHLAQGATSVYGYSAGQETDFAYHYAADPGSSYVVSGTAFSYMSATDTVMGVSQTYFNVGVGFLLNTGVAKNPGGDYAYIIDSRGNDAFVGGTSFSYMYIPGTNAPFAEFDAAYGFALVFAQSFVGGTDTATNNDSSKNILVGFR